MGYRTIGRKFMMNANIETTTKYERCVFCGKPILVNEYTTDKKYWAHNASPLNEGYCCSECNQKRVLPYRFAFGLSSKSDSKKRERFVKWFSEGKSIF